MEAVKKNIMKLVELVAVTEINGRKGFMEATPKVGMEALLLITINCVYSVAQYRKLNKTERLHEEQKHLGNDKQ